MVKKITSILGLTVILAGCQTTAHTSEKGDEKTISVFTGSVAEDGVLYRRDFEEAAVKACPEGYEVKERSRRPSTLTKSDYNRHHFHWVIKCHK